jgi:hypothetical protein
LRQTEKVDSAAARATDRHEKGGGMEDKRSCVWMQGPKEAALQVSAAKWWLAITRDVMANEYRRMAAKHRPPVTCDMTPKFVSPLEHQKHG